MKQNTKNNLVAGFIVIMIGLVSWFVMRPTTLFTLETLFNTK